MCPGGAGGSAGQHQRSFTPDLGGFDAFCTLAGQHQCPMARDELALRPAALGARIDGGPFERAFPLAFRLSGSVDHPHVPRPAKAFEQAELRR